MPEVWFIRHGESTSNAGIPTNDPVSIKLTERGLTQAQIVAAAIPSTPDLIIYSTYFRAKQTAEATMARFADTPHEEWPVQEFTYLAATKYKQTTLYERVPWAKAYWERGDANYYDGDGAETFAAFCDRIAGNVAALQARPEKFILVYTHGLYMRGLLWHLLRGSAESSKSDMPRFFKLLRSVTVPNGGIMKVKLNGDEHPWFSRVMAAHLPAHLIEDVAVKLDKPTPP